MLVYGKNLVVVFVKNEKVETKAGEQLEIVTYIVREEKNKSSFIIKQFRDKEDLAVFGLKDVINFKGNLRENKYRKDDKWFSNLELVAIEITRA